MDKLYTLQGKPLTRREIYMFRCILHSKDGIYGLPLGEHSWPRIALDMLVLSGVIERVRSTHMDSPGEWMNEWIVTEAGMDWADCPEVQHAMNVCLHSLDT